MMNILGEHGFDSYAFNFPGHGNGKERSVVHSYQHGDYGFNKLVSEYFPAMVDYVSEGGRHKVTVIGHSMGGMVPRAALIDGTIRASDIESMVLLGSPAHFDQKTITETFDLNYFGEQALARGRGDEPFNLTSNLIDNDLKNAFVLWPFPLFWMAKGAMLPFKLMELRGVIVITNFIAEDRVSKAVTDGTPKDIFRSFFAFKKDGYPYKDREVPVPILHIAGQLDGLAPWKDILASARVQSEKAGFWFIKLNGVSHVDLVATRVIKRYESQLLEFLKNPANLGEANRTHIEIRSSCADGIL